MVAKYQKADFLDFDAEIGFLTKNGTIRDIYHHINIVNFPTISSISKEERIQIENTFSQHLEELYHELEQIGELYKFNINFYEVKSGTIY